jgi:ribosomal protein L11 methyltransferase
VTTVSTSFNTSTYELTFPLPSHLCDWVCDILSGTEAVDSVQLRYSDDDPGLEVPYLVQVYSQHADVQERITPVLESLEAVAPLLSSLTFELNIIAEADWAESWKQHWHVDTVIAEALTICPTWEAHTPTHPKELVLRLDPGSAFGTGTHETTRLMLKALHHEHLAGNLEQARLIDLGCGSGILGIASYCWGASQVLGIDIDPQAIVVAQTNAQLNQLPEAVTHWTTQPLDTLPTHECDVMVANILGPVIIELLPQITRVLKPQGILWCSGLIESSCQEVQTALEALGYTGFTRWQENRWFALKAIGPTPTPTPTV